jgi:WD40 repeat protein
LKEALALQHAATCNWHEVSLLCSRAFETRKGVAWGEYAGGKQQHRVVLDEGDAWSLCECGGRVFGGLVDRSLLEWDASTLEERRRLRCEGQVGEVFCITACGVLVISGHNDDCLRVWNTATGGCDHVLRGHTSYVWCIASMGKYVVSGSLDNTIKVWSTEGSGSWPCLGTIAVHTKNVNAVLVWEGRVISGSSDKTIVVSDIVTRLHEATLDAHTGAVCALAVSGRTLVSTDYDLYHWHVDA